MFRLILGDISAKKENYIYHLVKENAEKGTYRQIVLVPETLSHHAERMLCAICGDSISLTCEVLTFRRFSDRVLTAFGGLADVSLDEGGRILLMYRAYQLVQAKLTLYHRAENTTELLESFLAVIDELIQAGITPQALTETADTMDGKLRHKLKDLTLIYAAYTALCENRDPKDTLTKVADILEEHADFYTGTSLYLFGFTGFTPQEKRIVKHLVKNADEVYAAFDCPDTDERDPDSVYAKPAKNAWQLRAYAGEVGKRIETVTLESRKEPSDLVFLEQNFFTYNSDAYPDEPKQILLRTASTPYAECAFAASEILRMIASTGARYRDFAVLTADPDGYQQTLSAVFERYHLPIFDGVKSEVMETPAAVFIDAALKAVTEGFESADIFRWLKTGLTHVSYDDIEQIENYCLRYDLTGSAWTSEKEWHMNPDALSSKLDESAENRLQQINRIRTVIRTPLLSLKQALSKGQAGTEKAAAFYDFLIDCNLFETLAERAEALRQMGELTAADEYDRIGDVLCTCFDSFADTLGDLPMTLTQFAELFLLCLSRYDVSVIPSSIDRIHTGTIGSVGFHRPKLLFILGMTDDVLPAAVHSGGILSDPDRTKLEEAGIELSDTPSLRAAQERLALLQAFAAPTEKLILSHSQTNAAGSANRPSPYLERITTLFPQCSVQSESDFSYKLYSPEERLAYAVSRSDPTANALYDILHNDPTAMQILAGSKPNREPLANIDTNRALYGSKLWLTASRIDCFNTCPYQFFSRYGLKLKPRKKIEFDAPEAGTFLHFILEHTIRDCETEFGRFALASYADVCRISDWYIEQYIHEELGDFEDKTPRFQYLFHRLKDTVYDLLEDLRNEFSHSQFRPTDFELQFGRDDGLPAIEVPIDETRSGAFIGVVDRVDTYKKDGTLYLRVVDYKSGIKTFSYSDLQMGLGLQMPLYLAALEDTFEAYCTLHKEYADVSQSADAGVLYMPARFPVIPSHKHLNNADYSNAIFAEMTRSGVVTDDPEILTAMEDTVLTNAVYLPVKYNQNGTLSKTSNAISDADFALLKEEVRRQLKQTARRIHNGVTDAAPICEGTQARACDYCDYRTACHFSEHFDTLRRKHSIKPSDYFAQAAMREKGDEQDG